MKNLTFLILFTLFALSGASPSDGFIEISSVSSNIGTNTNYVRIPNSNFTIFTSFTPGATFLITVNIPVIYISNLTSNQLGVDFYVFVGLHDEIYDIQEAVWSGKTSVFFPTWFSMTITKVLNFEISEKSHSFHLIWALGIVNQNNNNGLSIYDYPATITWQVIKSV